MTERTIQAVEIDFERDHREESVTFIRNDNGTLMVWIESDSESATFTREQFETAVTQARELMGWQS